MGLALALTLLLAAAIAITDLAGRETANAATAAATTATTVAAAVPATVPITAAAPAATVSASPRRPAAAARYEVQFTTREELRPLVDGIVMTLHEDIRVPPGINPLAVQLRATALTGAGASGPGFGWALSVALDQADDPRRPTTLTIFPGDLSEAAGFQNIAAGARVTVTFTRQAGLANPTEGGSFFWTVRTTRSPQPVAAAHPDPSVRRAFGELAASRDAARDAAQDVAQDVAEDGAQDGAAIVTGLLVDREVQLSHRDIRRDETVTVIGRGYKNGTTLTFWRDANFNGRQDPGESELCRTEVGGNDIGFCSFTVANPPFRPGFGDCALTRPAGAEAANCNFVNGVDGRNQSSTLVREEDAANVEEADQTLELGAGVAALFGAKSGAGPGQQFLVQLTDFPAGELTAVDVGGVPVELPGPSDRTVPASGSLHFSVDLPNRAAAGYQSLRVTITRRDNGEEFEARTTVRVGRGALLRVTPEKAVPNQRISVAGYGFSGAGAAAEIETISIGDQPIDPARINGGAGRVQPDSGGRWSASIDLPINTATTQAGARELRARGRDGRQGTGLVNFPAREVTITPPQGRPGTTAVVAGKNFPSKNDNGSGFALLIVYPAGGRQTLATAEPDSSGNFTAEIRIPATAPIPSTNTVSVEFVDDAGVTVTTLATHHVPSAAITLSPIAGPPGTAVTLSVQGFKQYMPVNEVKVGAIEVTPSPRPFTNREGEVALEVIIPGVDPGLQPVTVTAGGITVSASFTIIPSGRTAGAATPAGRGVANLGNRFVKYFHYDNDAKTWTFYDPASGAASTQDRLVAGESYWFLVRETTEAILNGRERRLTCAGGNCWNLIVW